MLRSSYIYNLDSIFNLKQGFKVKIETCMRSEMVRLRENSLNTVTIKSRKKEVKGLTWSEEGISKVLERICGEYYIWRAHERK